MPKCSVRLAGSPSPGRVTGKLGRPWITADRFRFGQPSRAWCPFISCIEQIRQSVAVVGTLSEETLPLCRCAVARRVVAP